MFTMKFIKGVLSILILADFMHHFKGEVNR